MLICFYILFNSQLRFRCRLQESMTGDNGTFSEIKDNKKHLSCSLTCPGENNSSFSVECKVKLIDRLLLKKGKIMKGQTYTHNCYTFFLNWGRDYFLPSPMMDEISKKNSALCFHCHMNKECFQVQHLVGWDGVGSKDSARCVRSDLGHFYDFSLGIEGTVLTSNIMHCTLSYVTLTLYRQSKTFYALASHLLKLSVRKLFLIV